MKKIGIFLLGICMTSPMGCAKKAVKKTPESALLPSGTAATKSDRERRKEERRREKMQSIFYNR